MELAHCGYQQVMSGNHNAPSLPGVRAKLYHRSNHSTASLPWVSGPAPRWVQGSAGTAVPGMDVACEGGQAARTPLLPLGSWLESEAAISEWYNSYHLAAHFWYVQVRCSAHTVTWPNSHQQGVHFTDVEVDCTTDMLAVPHIHADHLLHLLIHSLFSSPSFCMAHCALDLARNHAP